MKNMKKLGIIIIGIIIVATALAGCLQNGKKIEEIKIGAILPMTGDQASYGVALKKGMDLALEQINNKGGIQGKNLTIVYEDDQGDPKTGVSAFRKLVTSDKTPMVIGAMFSAVTLSIAPIAEQQKVVLLSPTSSAVELTNAGDYIFRIYPSDTYDGVFLADFAYNKYGARNISIIYLQAASFQAINKVFTEKFENFGGKIISSQGYAEGETDFRTQLLKVKSENPDIEDFD